MTTIGKRYLDRTKPKDQQRLLDMRTRNILNAVLSEPRGKCLNGYLRAMGLGLSRKLLPIALVVLEVVAQAH